MSPCADTEFISETVGELSSASSLLRVGLGLVLLLLAAVAAEDLDAFLY